LTTLLIDADIIAYTQAVYHEVATEVEPGYWTWYVDYNKVLDGVKYQVNELVEIFEADDHILCLSDTDNFRKSILPTYKGNRSNLKRPIVLKEVRKWMLDQGAHMKPGLEGDDLLGIYSTSMKDTIIVTIDKDMKTIPGAMSIGGNLQIITEKEADYWHFFQTLTGDTIDGYSGCPGIGAVNAKRILDEDPSWESVVKTFNKKGFTEEDALVQARCARILRASDYNFDTEEVILWTPQKGD
jgi:DNA polymerase I